MKPRRTHDSNSVYRLVGGTEDNDLWTTVTFDSERPEVPVVLSVWEPTDEERARIAAGENIQLAVWGGQPPVAVQVTDTPLGKPPTNEEHGHGD
jgi:hypothetical protein